MVTLAAISGNETTTSASTLLDEIIAKPIGSDLATLAVTINGLHEAAGRSACESLDKACRCGQFLIQAKHEVGHGNFGQWLHGNCPGICDRTARRYMKLARGIEHIFKTDTLSDLTMAMAMKLICRAERKAKPSKIEDADTIAAQIESTRLPDPPEQCDCGDDQEPSFEDGEWWCEACGARIDAPEDKPVAITITKAETSAAKTTGCKITAKSIKKAADKPSGIFGEIDFDAEPENPKVCAKAADGNHVWDDDADGRFCSACKCDYIASIHGQPQGSVAEVNDEPLNLPPQPRWAAAAGSVAATLQARGNSETRSQAEQMIRRLAAILDDLEAGRITIDDLRRMEAGQ